MLIISEQSASLQGTGSKMRILRMHSMMTGLGLCVPSPWSAVHNQLCAGLQTSLDASVT